EKLVIPDRVPSALDPHRCIFDADILKLSLVLEEPPVRDVHFYGACIDQGIILFVPDQGVMQQHLVKEGKIDASDTDGGMEVPGQAGSNLRDEPGLNRRQLDQHPSRYQ